MTHDLSNLDQLTGGELRSLVDELFNDCAGRARADLFADLTRVADAMNDRARVIARKYNKRFIPFTAKDLTFNRDAQLALLAD